MLEKKALFSAGSLASFGAGGREGLLFAEGSKQLFYTCAGTWTLTPFRTINLKFILATISARRLINYISLRLRFGFPFILFSFYRPFFFKSRNEKFIFSRDRINEILSIILFFLFLQSFLTLLSFFSRQSNFRFRFG